MQFLVFLACALVSASAGSSLYQIQNVPVNSHNSVPHDTHEVAVEKALHLHAHAAAAHGIHISHPRAGHHNLGPDGRPLDTPEVQIAKELHFIAYKQAAFRNANPHTAPYAAAAAGPLETPEVQLAKAAHFAAHLETNTHTVGDHYRKRREIARNRPQHVPVIGPDGVPTETPEILAAKARHFAFVAKAAAAAARKPSSGQYKEHDSYTPPSIPQIQAPKDHYTATPTPYGNKIPIDTPEVQAAKAQHFAAFAKAASRKTSNSRDRYDEYPTNHDSYNNHVASPQGAPADTPEVQAAKAQHYAALAKAAADRKPAAPQQQYNDYNSYQDSSNGYYQQNPATNNNYNNHYNAAPVDYANGVIVDTPEVQAAKAQHYAVLAKAAAHQAALASQGQYNEYNSYDGSYSNELPAAGSESQAVSVHHLAPLPNPGVVYQGVPAAGHYTAVVAYGNGVPGSTGEIQASHATTAQQPSYY